MAATPEGPTVTYSGNSTRSITGGTMVNYTGGVSQNTSGGYIFSINLDAFQGNTRWKAYYGNVTGTLTLDDAGGSTIYRWPISTAVVGNVYATRASGTISWSSIACATVAQIESENFAMNHTTTPSDNITKTFNSTSHTDFIVAGTTLPNCRATATWVRDAVQNQTSNDNYQEIVAFDGTNIIYVTNIENNEVGYNNATTDFQIIVPERGHSTWASSTAYYFYVELQ